MANLPGALNPGPFSSMFWTISVEFQFYLLFPLIAYGDSGATASRPSTALLIALIAAFAARVLAAFMGVEVSMIWFCTQLGRIDQFLLGMAAAKLFMMMPGKRWGVFLVPALALLAKLGEVSYSMYLMHILIWYVSSKTICI